jgi:hypothetical protein
MPEHLLLILPFFMRGGVALHEGLRGNASPPYQTIHLACLHLCKHTSIQEGSLYAVRTRI